MMETDLSTNNLNRQIEFIVNFNPASFNIKETVKPHCILQKFDFDVKKINPDSDVCHQLYDPQWSSGQSQDR